METNCLPCPYRDSCCPILCIIKVTVLALLVMFILVLPLGDPNTQCDQNQKRQMAMCCICDVYAFAIKVSKKIRELAEVSFCVLLDALYELKLKFYSLLGRLDRKDLCRSVCCLENMDINDAKKELKRRCSCSRKCSKARAAQNN